ncbi:MAG TPA: hypothetical protein VGN20_20635 [Mucilaginibacter sp.]|jgi:hypothetical protein
MEKKYKAWSYFVISVYLTFAIVLLLSGCSTYIRNHQITKQHLFNYKYPDQLAVDCAKTFPVKDSIGKATGPVNTNYTGKIDSLQGLANNLNNVIDDLSSLITSTQPGKPLDTSKYLATIKYLQNKISLLQKSISSLQASYKPCKNDTVPHYIIDNAKLTVFRNKNKAVHDSLTTSKTDLKSVTHGRNIWMYIAIGCITVLFGGIVISAYKFFSGGAITGTIKKIL